MAAGTIRVMGSEFMQSIVAVWKKFKPDPIPYMCNAVLKAHITSPVSRDGRCVCINRLVLFMLVASLLYAVAIVVCW